MIYFFLRVFMFLGEVIYYLVIIYNHFYFSILLTICTVDFVGRLAGQVIQIPELTPWAHMRELKSISVGVGQHLNKLGTIPKN